LSSKIKNPKLKKSVKKDISVKAVHQNDKNCCISWKQPINEKNESSLHHTSLESQIYDFDKHSQKLINLEKEL
jgi:hypothetical protein